MKKIVFLLALLTFLPIKSINAQETDSTKLTIANIVTIHSKILNEDRKIYIYSPDQAAGPYLPQASAVLYLMDGAAHTALVASQVQYLSEVYGVFPNMIVVGIANYGYDRLRDLTPTYSLMGYNGKIDSNAASPLKSSGGGEKFLQFVEEEVMPYVEDNYKTTPFKIFSGHSLGGLVSFYCLTVRPDLFNAYIAISPSLWWDNESLLKSTAENLDQGEVGNKFLFFSDASEGGRFHKDLLDLDSLLKEINIPGFKYKYVYYPEETHGSEPVKAEYDALKFIYAKWKPSPTDTTVALINKFYEQLSDQYGYTVVPPENVINVLGYTFMNVPEKIDEAIELLKLNVENYPSSFNVYDSLGDAFVVKGDKAKAITNYEKAIELNPKSELTKTKLMNIKKIK